MKNVFSKKWYGVPVLVFALVGILTVGGIALAAGLVSNIWTSPTITVTGGGGGGGTTPTNEPLVISSGFASNLSISTGQQAEFSIRLENPSEAGAPGYNAVRVKFEISDGDGVLSQSDVTLEYQSGGVYYNLPVTLESGKLVGWFGPPTGFDCPSGYNETTPIRATFNAVGTYQAAVQAETVS